MAQNEVSTEVRARDIMAMLWRWSASKKEFHKMNSKSFCLEKIRIEHMYTTKK